MIMKIRELRRKTEKELRDLLNEDRRKLGRLRFDVASKKVKDVRQIRTLRRDAAKILTILNERFHEKRK